MTAIYAKRPLWSRHSRQAQSQPRQSVLVAWCRANPTRRLSWHRFVPPIHSEPSCAPPNGQSTAPAKHRFVMQPRRQPRNCHLSTADAERGRHRQSRYAHLLAQAVQHSFCAQKWPAPKGPASAGHVPQYPDSRAWLKLRHQSDMSHQCHQSRSIHLGSSPDTAGDNPRRSRM